jgi:fused signal recognition particle receptor
MGLINWLKQKIFHKKDEDKKEVKPVEPVEENLKSEEAKDKTSGESVVEKALEGNKVDEEPIFEAKKEEIKEESLQPEVVKKEQSVEQSIEDKVETKEEPVVEENTLEEPVQPEIKEEQKIEEQPVEKNKVEDNSSIKDEEKYEPSKEDKQSSFEEPVIQNNTDGIENNNEFEHSNPLLDLVLEDKLEKKESKVEVNDEQPIEDKAETKEEPIVEKELSDEPVQPEIKEEQHAEENRAKEKENEEDEVIEEKEEQTKEAEQVNSTDEPVIEKKNDEATTKKVEVDHETKIYNLGLAKSREGFGARLNSIANKYKEANSDYFDDLERCLIEADVGVNLTMSVLDETEKMAASQHLDNPKEINDLLVDNLFMNYAKSGDSFQTEIKFDPENPTVLLMVGVNGTGKTTTIAKLAKHYKELGKKVLLVAADTFRAGAVQQLSIWANRIGVDIFERGQGADPASVCFDAVKKAINDKYDLVMVDTAGRLHTKDYLMAELGKVNRVIKKVLPVAPQEIWLALDANTGQNGVQQAKVFKEVTPLTGVVITKMDGTSKGGIILAIRDQLGVPVRFIGLGEHEDDLREFDLDRYLYALLVGEDENFEE